MKRLFTYLFLLVVVLVVGSCSVDCHHKAPPPHSFQGNPDQHFEVSVQHDEKKPMIDLTSKPLDLIPVGTVIGKGPLPGWSNLVLFVVPTLTEEDRRDAPQIAMYYAEKFNWTLLANVGRREGPGPAPFWLQKFAWGFATAVDGEKKIVRGKQTFGADMGMFGRKILDENETCINEGVRQVVRTPTMLIFDGKAVMLRGTEHQNMIMRHVVLVDPTNGKLYTLVWLLTNDYETAEDTMQLLPNSMWEKRLLSVKRDKFNLLGIPTKEAFALRQVPQGTAIPYQPQLRQIATVKTFTEQLVPQVEEVLRATAIRAAGQ